MTGRLSRAADAFKSSGVFEQIADEIRDNYTLSYPVSFRAKRCGEPNAFYDAAKVQVIYCYEFMDEMMDLYAANTPVDFGPSRMIGRAMAAIRK